MSLFVQFLWFVIGHVGRIICDISTIIFSPIIFLYYHYTCNKFIQKKQFKSVLITGGSSGIGKAIATQFIKNDPTIKTIIITGRNERRLNKTVKELQSIIKQRSNLQQTTKKAKKVTNTGNTSDLTNKIIHSADLDIDTNTIGNTIIESKVIDVTNKDGMKEFILLMDDKYELNLIIANAGTNARLLNNEDYLESSSKVLNVNCYGVLNTILPIIPRFRERKKGHIAINGSMVSFIPNAQGAYINNYSASKVYTRYLFDDIRPKLKLIDNIDVSYIAPGYVRSRMAPENTHNNKLGYMYEDIAANIIINGLKNNNKLILFPNNMLFVSFLFGTIHPILNMLVLNQDVNNRDKDVKHVGARVYHEFDPNDQFGAA